MSTTVTYKGSTIANVNNNTKTLKTAGKYMEDDVTLVDVTSGGSGGTYQAKTNIDPTTSSQTITADSGYDALSSVQINAMPVGVAGTPTATKGTVSNNSVSVTPSVTNTTGYITGSTETGTPVTVSASELVSGSETKTENGTYDVTNLAELIVNVSGGGGGADLRSLTVTPSHEKQVFDGENAWIINKSACRRTSNQIKYTLDMMLNDVPLTSGKTYAVTGTWERAGKDRTYTVDTSVTWMGSGTTVSISTFTGTFDVDATGYITFSISVTSTDEDVDANPLELCFAADSTFDGFDKVTVNPIPGNVVTGTFKGTITGAAMDVTLNYFGSGYPVACIVYPEEGANNSEGAFYSLLQRYAVAFWCGVKENISTPTYSSTYSQNLFSYACRYKSSATTASSQGGNTGIGANTLRNGNAGNTRGDCVRFKSATTMSVYIASTSYGFAANINYKYCVIYSS